MEIKVTVPMRQAFLSVHTWYPWQDVTTRQDSESSRIPVLVWPMPDTDGRFVVEHEDGTCSKAWPHELTFLDSKEQFDQCDWRHVAGLFCQPRGPVNIITCDKCGQSMTTHENRYTVTVSSVPAFRSVDKCVFDFCPACATRMKLELSNAKETE